jgi:hypothetical protein
MLRKKNRGDPPKSRRIALNRTQRGLSVIESSMALITLITFLMVLFDLGRLLAIRTTLKEGIREAIDSLQKMSVEETDLVQAKKDAFDRIAANIRTFGQVISDGNSQCQSDGCLHLILSKDNNPNNPTWRLGGTYYFKSLGLLGFREVTPIIFDYEVFSTLRNQRSPDIRLFFYGSDVSVW